MEKMIKKMEEYYDFFCESFPSINFMHLSPDEIIEVIDKCLEEGKDVYSMGLIEEPSFEDRKY